MEARWLKCRERRAGPKEARRRSCWPVVLKVWLPYSSFQDYQHQLHLVWQPQEYTSQISKYRGHSWTIAAATALDSCHPMWAELLSTGYSQPVTKPGRTLKQACSWETHLETLCRASAAAFLSFHLESCCSRRHYLSSLCASLLRLGSDLYLSLMALQPLMPPHFFHRCSPEKSLAYFGIYFLEDSG